MYKGMETKRHHTFILSFFYTFLSYSNISFGWIAAIMFAFGLPA